MKKLAKNTLLIILLLAALVLIIFACGLVWLYSGRLTPSKTKAFLKLPLPMALVNNNPVPAKSFITRQLLAEKLPAGKTIQDLDIYNQIISESEISQIAAGHGIGISAFEVNKAYNDYAAQENFSGQASFNDLLAGYGISRQIFIDQTVEPTLLAAKLQTWFYSQPDLNAQSYGQAKNLLDQIQAGKDIGQLAKQFSQDGSSADLQGDLGFIDLTKLLPELQEGVDSLSVGQVKILPSRFGIQIVKLEGKSGSLLHLRSIYIKGSDFQTWLTGQEQKFKVIKLINI